MRRKMAMFVSLCGCSVAAREGKNTEDTEREEKESIMKKRRMKMEGAANVLKIQKTG